MRSAVVIALVAFLLQPVDAQDAKGSVVGLWLGEARTEGGLGNWMDFHADGTVDVGFGVLIGALLDDTYRLEGTTLVLRVFSGKVTPAGTPVFETIQKRVQIQGDRVVVESQWPAEQAAPTIDSPAEQAAFDRMRQPVTMRRDGPATPAASPMAGTWSYQHYTGPTAYETFTPGGKWYLRIPMSRRQSRYTVTSAAVIVESAQQSDTFSRNGDVLMSGPADGKHSTYRRAPE